MVYYVETNLIAIAVAVVLLLQGRKISSVHETSQILLDGMLRLLIMISISDIAAYYFRGKSFAGVQVANILYFIIMAIGSYVWFLYILVVTGKISDLKKTIITTGLPTFLLCAAFLTNPWTAFFFTVDQELLYHRGPGIPVTWVLEWAYLLCALVVNLRCYLQEQRGYKKSEYRGYLIFSVPLAVAAICQMLFYGTTTTQVGFMIALLMAFVNKQHFQVQRDDLTGLNNKNAFLSYRDSMLNRSKEVALTMFMLDLDKFKTINDVYGHLKGDQALKDMADVLRTAVSAHSDNRARLYRYGGDEFIILAEDYDEELITQLKRSIDSVLEVKNRENREKGEAYILACSVGSVSMHCSSISDFDELLRKADAAMYEIKKTRGQSRS